MSDRRSSPIHLGGPLGLAGLTALAGAAGLMVIAGNEESKNGAAGPASGIAIETADDVRSGTGETAATERAGTAEGTIVAEQPVISEPQETRSLGGSKPETIALPASAQGAEIVYIVRLKGHPEIDTIARNFKRNPDTAQEAYGQLCERLPALKEFQLVGASYSGEIKLAYQLAPGREPTRAVINDIKDKIMAIEGVAYADPDFVAHPGEDRK